MHAGLERKGLCIMKKLIALLLVLVMAMFGMAGCGGSGSGGSSEAASIDSVKTIGDVIALEAEETQFSVYKDVVVYAFKLGDTYYRVRAAITPEQAQAYFDIDYSDADYEDQQKKIVSPLAIDEIEELNDQILSQDELDALVGKTGQELQDEGWTYSGHDLESMEFWMNYGPFVYTVVFDGQVAEADYDSFDDEEGTSELTVKSAQLSALGDATFIEDEE